MTGRIGIEPAPKRYLLELQGSLSQSAAACLVAFCVLLAGSWPVAAQDSERRDESSGIILDLSEEEPIDEELPTGRRLMLEIPLPSLKEEEKDLEKVRPPGEPTPPTAASEAEFREIIRQMQQDLEMLKEEIAQLRSEFRSLKPDDSEGDAVTKRTVNPFWISDAQLERQDAG